MQYRQHIMEATKSTSTGKLVGVGTLLFAAMLIFLAPLPHTALDKANAQQIETISTLAEIRKLAKRAEVRAKNSRKSIDGIGRMIMSPAYLIPNQPNETFMKRARKGMQRLFRGAPDESLEAIKTAHAIMKALKYQAHTFDALAKKLRQEADRLERQQKKKN